MLNTAYFKHRKAETLLRLKVTWLSCQQAKTFFGSIERPKCSLVTETENKVVLRKTILRQRNSAKRKQNRCFSKIKWKSGWLAAYWKKTFFWCNKTENNPILQQTNQTCFLCYKAESNIFLQRKRKNAFFCDIKLKAARFCCQHTKTYFRYYESRKRAFRNGKRNHCLFVTKCSKHPISLPTRQNMFSIR